MRSGFASVILVSCAAAICASASHGQNFPSKPIRVVAAEAGSTNDIVARVMAGGMTANLGQQVLVDNRGGGGAIAPDIVSKAAPDGYTLIFNGSQLWLAQFLRSKVEYSMSQFTPIGQASSSPGFLVVHPSVPANSVKELIALAKAKPGTLNYATGSPGALNQLAPELFRHMTGTNMVGVPYRGGGPALAAAVAGQVQLAFVTAGGVGPHIKAGRLKGLGATSAKRTALFPEMPTIAEAGVPGFEIVALNGVLAPAKTPNAVIRRLNQAMVEALTKPEVKDKMLAAGIEMVASSPEAFATVIKNETVTLGKVIKDAGIHVD